MEVVYQRCAGLDVHKKTVVYSPKSEQTAWHSVRFRVVPGNEAANEYQVVKERDLKPDEIAYFERLIAGK
jgi:hypothetical protein